MFPVWRIVRQAVTLDWALAWAAVRHAGSDAAMPAAIGVLLLSVSLQSALETGLVLRTAPASVARALVLIYLWGTALVAIGTAAAAGVGATADRIAAVLHLKPVTRAQRLAVRLALSCAGRYAAAGALPALPVLGLAAVWLPADRLPAVLVALFLMQRLVPGLISVAAAWGRGRKQRWAMGAALGLVALVFAVDADAITAVAALLPPAFVADIVFGSRAGAAWLGLLGWTIGVAVLEWSVSGTGEPSSVSGSPRVGWHRSGIARRRGPWGLVDGELRRLARWPRFRLAWGVAAAVAVLVVSRIDVASSGLVAVTALALLPPFVASSVLANVFGPDRAAAQAYFLGPVRPDMVLTTKLIAVAVFVIAAELVLLVAVLGALPRPLRATDLYAAAAAVGFFIWVATLGSALSVLFPRASPPDRLDGGLLPAEAALVLVPSVGLFAGAAVAVAFFFDGGRLGTGALAGVTVLVVAIPGGVAWLVSRTLTRLFDLRLEDMLRSLQRGSAMLP